MESQKHTKLSWLGAIVIALLVVGLAFGGSRLLQNRMTQNTFGKYVRIDLPANQGLQVVDDGFVYYDGTTLSRIDSRGKTIWSCLIGAGADFDAQKSGIAVWSGDLLTLINWSSGTSESSSPLGTDIISARLGSKYAAVLLAPEHNGNILLLEPGGRQVDNIDMSGKTVLNYGFFSDDSLFWVMALDTSGTVPTCEITTYNPGKRIVGSISDTEQLMYQVLFQSTQVCCVGETNIKIFDYTGTENEDKRKLIYGWILASSDSDSADPLMVYVLSDAYSSGGEVQDIRLIKGNSDEVLRMPFPCTSLVARGNRTYGFSRDGYIMVVGMEDQRVEAYPTGLDIAQVYGVTSDNVAVAGNGLSLFLINLP